MNRCALVTGGSGFLGSFVVRDLLDAGFENVVVLMRGQDEAEAAAKGQDFFIGIIAILGGLFCVIKTSWFLSVFPTLAVIYGLLQLVLGFSKVQRMVDFLRMKFSLWYLPAISALIYLVFGFIIVLHPDMTFMSIWVFTGVTMILEAAFNAVCIWMLEKGRLPKKEKEKKNPEPVQAEPEPEQDPEPQETDN